MNKKEFAPFALRVGIGGMFVLAGLMKMLNSGMVVQMMTGLGFPGPVLWAWLLIIVELLFGAAVLMGFQLKYTTIPLGVVMLVAIPVAFMNEPMSGVINVALLSGLVSLWLSGPGAFGLSKPKP